MNVVFNIGLYMIASSLIMIGYVWFKYIKHVQSTYKQISETHHFTEEELQSAEKNLAA